MRTTVYILCASKPEKSDLAFAGMVDFSGLKYEIVDVSDFIGDGNGNCWALSGKTLSTIHENRRLAGNLKSLLDTTSFLFVYGISPDSTRNEALGYLADGTVKSVSPLPDNDYTYNVGKNYREICRHFSGLTFGPIDNRVDFTLDTGRPDAKLDTLITVDEKPLFARLQKEKCTVFLLATGEIFDISEDTFQLNNTQVHFSRLAPVMMFLKYAFKDYCWHNDNNQACLIIDDPPLKRKYGSLEYTKLLEAMDANNYFTSIAFIPWNYKRTDKKIAKLFRERTDRYSLSIHGSNHTRQEFGSLDDGEIDFNVKQATMRMNAHRDITGLDYDKVMVFPHESFSTNSMLVLKSNNYLGAVNSIPPVNVSDRQSTPDLLRPTNLSYENFPLFHRRYPECLPHEIVDFAFDLFLGKPLIIFVHPDYFKEGYGGLNESVKKINSLADDILWRSPGDIFRTSYLQKREDDNTISVKQYSSSIIIKNTANKTTEYLVRKEETGNISIKDVLVNGDTAPYRLEDGVIKIDVSIPPEQATEVRIIYEDLWPEERKNGGMGRKTKVFIRRHLTEFRDNYLGKNRLLLYIANRMSRLLS